MCYIEELERRIYTQVQDAEAAQTRLRETRRGLQVFPGLAFENPHAYHYTQQKADTKKSSEITHAIKQGDTLWSLAVKHLGSGHRWTEIQDLNGGPEKCDPHKLRIGSTLRLPAGEGGKFETNI